LPNSLTISTNHVSAHTVDTRCGIGTAHTSHFHRNKQPNTSLDRPITVTRNTNIQLYSPGYRTSPSVIITSRLTTYKHSTQQLPPYQPPIHPPQGGTLVQTQITHLLLHPRSAHALLLHIPSQRPFSETASLSYLTPSKSHRIKPNSLPFSPSRNSVGTL